MSIVTWLKRAAVMLCAVISIGLLGSAVASAAPAYKQASRTVTWYSVVNIKIFSLGLVASYTSDAGRIVSWNSTVPLANTYFILWDVSNAKAWWDYKNASTSYAYTSATFKHYVGIAGWGIPLDTHNELVSLTVKP
jgi:hypothetical protein